MITLAEILEVYPEYAGATIHNTPPLPPYIIVPAETCGSVVVNRDGPIICKCGKLADHLGCRTYWKRP